MNSQDISHQLMCMYSNQEHRLLNTYVFEWESDFFCVSSSNYITEVEVKISRGDFKNDFKKTTPIGINKHEYLINPEHKIKPNKFIFACPMGLIQPEELDDKYGLIWFDKPNERSNYIIPHVKKSPKFLHKENLMNGKIIINQLMKKYYYRNLSLNVEVAQLKREIKNKLILKS